MSNEIPEEVLEGFLKQETASFSSRTIRKLYSIYGKKISLAEVRQILSDNPLVISISNDNYITRAGCFTGRYFEIKPTRYELEKGILIPGDRCMPFVDPEYLPNELTFIWEKRLINKKVLELSANEIVSHYLLYGEEYAAQYISMDPCNAETDFISTGYELPVKVNLTILDMGDFYTKSAFEYGDRIRAYVSDWAAGIVSIEPACIRKTNPFERTEEEENRLKWNIDFEKTLSYVLRKKGPCISIEEQLALTYAYGMGLLSLKGCGSVEEFLLTSDKIVLSDYGMETRLWFTDSDITPKALLGKPEEEQVVLNETLYEEYHLPLPNFMIDVLILDSLFNKEKDDSDLILRVMKLGFMSFEKVKSFQALVHQKYIKESKKYNWFADFPVGEIRNTALELYFKLLKIVEQLEKASIPLENLPQQETIVMAQLIGHLVKLLNLFYINKSISDTDIETSKLSLEGMKFSCNEIQPIIEKAMTEYRKQSFSVIKQGI